MCIKSIVYRSFSCSQMRRVFELKCEWLVKKQSFLKLWTFLKFFVLSSFSCTNSYIQKILFGVLPDFCLVIFPTSSSICFTRRWIHVFQDSFFSFRKRDKKQKSPELEKWTWILILTLRLKKMRLTSWATRIDGAQLKCKSVVKIRIFSCFSCIKKHDSLLVYL